MNEIEMKPVYVAKKVTTLILPSDLQHLKTLQLEGEKLYMTLNRVIAYYVESLNGEINA